MFFLFHLKRCKTFGRFLVVVAVFFFFTSIFFLSNLSEIGARSRENDEKTFGNIVRRLEILENNFSHIYKENAVEQNTDVNAVKKRVCPIPVNWRHPFCTDKVRWLKTLWQKNEKCYIKRHDVNPSDDCTILRFMSEQEAWCPLLPGRERLDPLPSRPRASIRTDKEGLIRLLKSDNWVWMRDRASMLWPHWVAGAQALQQRKADLDKRPARNILVFFGTFSVEPRFFTEAYHGGPLGELVQWTDVVCALYILGHNITVSANTKDLKRLLNVPPVADCASKARDDEFDQIYTDYNGLKLIAIAVGPNHSQYRCRVRVVDSFGTEAEFNYAEYPMSLPGGRSPWANADLNLRQIMTMFPHSPDNTFLGFVVDSPLKTHNKRATDTGKPIGLVYGKEARFWKEKRSYLDTLHKYMELHATVSGPQEDVKNFLPDYVVNHGILKSEDLQKLLVKAKVFIGLGFPFEGPAPLEAIARGSVFLNAKLDPPLNRLNSNFFKLKPTFRALTSQHPYAEDFIGEPHVVTVDIKNLTLVENALKKIMKSKVEPYLPLEWTPEGLLERINAYVENLNFCTKESKTWPPEDQLQLIQGNVGDSCKDACRRKGLLCESLHFHQINSKESFKKLGIVCGKVDSRAILQAPSYSENDKSCTIQNHPLMFSCVASATDLARLCPCRDFQPQQVALCKKCS